MCVSDYTSVASLGVEIFNSIVQGSARIKKSYYIFRSLLNAGDGLVGGLPLVSAAPGLRVPAGQAAGATGGLRLGLAGAGGGVEASGGAAAGSSGGFVFGGSTGLVSSGSV